MSLYYIVVFLLVMSIPFVGGCFLYNELRWDRFHEKSVGYGIMYALVVVGMLMVDSGNRFIGNICDRIVLGSDVKTYFQDLTGVDEPCAFETISKCLHSNGDEVVRSYVEDVNYCRRIVFNYRGPLIIKRIDIPDAPKKLEIRASRK